MHNTMNDTIIRAQDAQITYDTIDAVTNATFDIHEGEFVAIAGPNGAGKTTLVKAILGLLPLSNGSISVFNTPIASFSDWHLIGYLPQYGRGNIEMSPLTVQEVIQTGAIAIDKKGSANTQYQNDIVKQLDLEPIKQKHFKDVSGGQKQRALLARALMGRPKLLILDEPTTALDPSGRNIFFSIIEELRTNNKTTVLIITHDASDVGARADTLLYVDKTIVFHGPFKTFCESSDMTNYFGQVVQHHICHQHIPHVSN